MDDDDYQPRHARPPRDERWWSPSVRQVWFVLGMMLGGAIGAVGVWYVATRIFGG